MVAPEPVRLVKVSHQFELDGRPLSVLDSVDLAVGQGEFVALWEPSGCGKTTLLRLIAGLERPRARRIFAGAREIASPDPSPVLVFQVSTLYPRRAVRQNAALGLEVRGLSRSQSHRIDHALRQVGLEGSAPVFWRYGAAHGTRSRSGR